MEQKKKVSAYLQFTKEGPIKVEGKFFIVDSQGNDLNADEQNEVYLCSCGKSKSKPFCDDSHKK
ncbi:MAG: CDGSH iron-sulfur domain-containing protein [Bacteroidales bacterium]